MTSRKSNRWGSIGHTLRSMAICKSVVGVKKFPLVNLKSRVVQQQVFMKKLRGLSPEQRANFYIMIATGNA